MLMHKSIVSFGVGLAFIVHASQQPSERRPLPIFAQIGLTSDEVATIDQGRPFAKVLSWGEASEVYVFGAVRVKGSPDTYLKSARDVGKRAGSSTYLGIGEVPATATVADLRGLTFDADDIAALKDCREGQCEIQLPSASMERFRKEVDWSRPDPSDQVNALARQMVLDLVASYRREGNGSLGTYGDKQSPASVAAEFGKIIGRASALPEAIPELRQYLLRYPEAELPGGDDFIYWEKVNFGMKPTIRVNHAVIYRARAGDGGVGAVAVKQLYSSHYFRAAVDVSQCVADPTASSPGFYLLTIKGSQQEGLTGVKGSMVRKVVVNKTRSALESGLGTIKRTVEQSAAPPQD